VDPCHLSEARERIQGKELEVGFGNVSDFTFKLGHKDLLLVA
jgi:hypothetical protein